MGWCFFSTFITILVFFSVNSIPGSVLGSKADQECGIYRKLMPKPEYFTRALYTIDIGQNDLTAGYFTNKTTDEVKAYVPDVINRLLNVVRNIYSFGGRYFWIHNTGPVGCLPYVFVRRPVPASLIDEAGCATPYNEVSQFFNSILQEAVVQLRKDLPSAAITYVDIYSIKYSLFHEGRKHGSRVVHSMPHSLVSLRPNGGKAVDGWADPLMGSSSLSVRGSLPKAGRFCDGRLLIDFIAEDLGLPYLSAYLDSMASNFSHGANFATAGSTIRPQNTSMTQSGVSPISLDVQYVQYSDFHQRSPVLRKQGGVFEKLLPLEDSFSRALYTFDIGQNDLTAGYKLNMTTDQVKGYVPDVLHQFSNVVKGIYAQGGRSFWVHNTDVYSLKYSLFTQAKKLGFKDPLRACCGHGGKYNFNSKRRCGSKIIENGKEIVIANACKDPSVKVIWDGIHFTEAANRWMFKQLVNGSFSDPPIPLKMACHRTTDSLYYY
ncbi:hypothetical protein QYF36_019883 [Acer negundo]|nr:hypothetical protein QYF36_019883 [Acer negundo]